MSETPEHGQEPVPGLPAYLPEGEKMLWQGAPDWRQFAIRTMHIRKVAMYFVALLIWRVVDSGSVAGHLVFVVLSAAGLGLLALLAFWMARSTLYTITSRRIVLRFGIAIPMSINLPFTRIDALNVRQKSATCTDISIGIKQNPDQYLSYIVMWPHARPWRFGDVQPMMRCLVDGEAVAEILQNAVMRDIDKDDLRQAIASKTKPNYEKPATQRPQYEAFPRAPLYGAAALVAFAIVSVAAIRLLGTPAPGAPIELALESVQLQFEDRAEGVIAVYDASSGVQLGQLPAGTDNFLRATLRGLVRGRDAMKSQDRSAFGLYQLDDGRLMLVDSVTGREVDLWAFGETNAGAFARFLPSRTLQMTQNTNTSGGEYDAVATEPME